MQNHDRLGEIFDEKSWFFKNPRFYDQKKFQDEKVEKKTLLYFFIVLNLNLFSLQYVVKIPSGARDTPIATSKKVDAISHLTDFRVTSFRSQLLGPLIIYCGYISSICYTIFGFLLVIIARTRFFFVNFTDSQNATMGFPLDLPMLPMQAELEKKRQTWPKTVQAWYITIVLVN